MEGTNDVNESASDDPVRVVLLSSAKPEAISDGHPTRHLAPPQRTTSSRTQVTPSSFGPSMNVTEIIHRYASLEPSSIDQTRVESLHDIGSSILFVLAVWSGQSIAAFKRLTEHLATLSTRPRLLVYDIDELPDEMRESLGQLRGVGETFWVHDGAILASLADYERDDWSEIVSHACQVLLRQS